MYALSLTFDFWATWNLWEERMQKWNQGTWRNVFLLQEFWQKKMLWEFEALH